MFYISFDDINLLKYLEDDKPMESILKNLDISKNNFKEYLFEKYHDSRVIGLEKLDVCNDLIDHCYFKLITFINGKCFSFVMKYSIGINGNSLSNQCFLLRPKKEEISFEMKNFIKTLLEKII